MWPCVGSGSCYKLNVPKRRAWKKKKKRKDGRETLLKVIPSKWCVPSCSFDSVLSDSLQLHVL